MKSTDKQRVLDFLKELKYSYKDMDIIFLEGSCYRLCILLDILMPNRCKFLYSEVDEHWITRIDDCFFDINGELRPDYVVFKDYSEQPDYIMQSAYVPTYKGQACSYSKYAKTV